jgi:hypothetical protein
MAKRDADPVLRQLVHAINESGQALVPVTVSAHGTLVTGVLISQEAYLSALAETTPLLSALQPASGLLGQEYATEVEVEADHHLHLRATGVGGDGLWRISLESVDGWMLGVGEEADDLGPFARLLSS